jgi:hypothetical protein
LSIVSDFGTKVGLRNIRIYQRINRTIDRLKLQERKLPQDVLNRLVVAISAACWAAYSKDPSIPTPLELTKFDGLTHSARRKGFLVPNATESKPMPWETTLAEIGWHPDHMDEFLRNLVATGLLDSAVFDEELKKYIGDEEKKQQNAAVAAPWELYHLGFSQDESRIFELAKIAFNTYPLCITPHYAETTLELLKSIGYVKESNELLKKQFLVWKEMDPSTLRHFSQQGDLSPKLRRRFESLIKSSSYRSIDELVERFLIEWNSWGAEEEEFAASLNAVAWFNYLEKPSVLNSQAAVRRIRRMYGSVREKRADRSTWISPLDAALKKMLKTGSRLNKLRVQKALKSNV